MCHIASEKANRFEEGSWSCDWDLSDDDCESNEVALRDGSRILSAYAIEGGHQIWIITEATDERGRRAATTILLPDEY